MGKLNTKLIFGIFLILLVGLIIADDKYTIVPGEDPKDIDEHEECRYVSSSSDTDYESDDLDVFVPTKTSTEWSDFRSNAPGHVNFGDSCCDSGTCCGDGTVNSDEECDGDSTSCEECCHDWACDGHGNCERTTERCEDGTKDCQDDCSGYGSCDASPSCTHYCDSDADCFG